ncbi:MAG TPA: TlpA disulfide reductase family protein [Pyrinomonadaceae bacterium]|nr:TlpA disulfide reductase family protein [Pyrinomonadaceae bacterium]
MKYFFGFIFCLVLAFTAFGQQKVGTQAESFNGTTLQGKDFILDDFRGKVVVMTFWSTKCAICHEEIPKLNKLVDKFSGKEVVFMGLTMENEDRITPYLQKRPFNFTIIPNSLGAMLKYADRDNQGNPNMGFPAYFIISPNGDLQYKSSGWDKINKIDSEVTRLLPLAGQNKSAEANTTAKAN